MGHVKTALLITIGLVVSLNVSAQVELDLWRMDDPGGRYRLSEYVPKAKK